MKILSSVIHSHVISNFYDCLYSVEHQGCNIEYYTGHSHAITVNWRFKKHHWMWSIRLVHYIPSLMNPCKSFISTDRYLGYYLMIIFVHKSIPQGFVKRINQFIKKDLTWCDHEYIMNISRLCTFQVIPIITPFATDSSPPTDTLLLRQPTECPLTRQPTLHLTG